MQFTTIAIIAASALTAFAAPTGTDPDCTTTTSSYTRSTETPTETPYQVTASPCENEQVQSCCNGDQNIPIMGGECYIPIRESLASPLWADHRDTD